MPETLRNISRENRKYPEKTHIQRRPISRASRNREGKGIIRSRRTLK
jgi:hypothetical protein